MAPVPDAAVDTPIDTSSPASPMIPASQAARIRAWVKYGMTVREVAEIYRVPVGEVQRVLRIG